VLCSYICTEIFPHGGVIVITDHVFNEKSIEASQIISLFVNKVKACGWVPDSVDSHEPNDEGFLLWRIATSPDFMKRTFEWCDAHPEAIDANLPAAQA
jgi:chromo domain-containing protein 1